MTSASSMHEAGHSKPVLWDNPEGWGREGGGRDALELGKPGQCGFSSLEPQSPADFLLILPPIDQV